MRYRSRETAQNGATLWKTAFGEPNAQRVHLRRILHGAVHQLKAQGRGMGIVMIAARLKLYP